MRIIFVSALIFLLFLPSITFAQAPNLGSVGSFVFFTSSGAVGNTGISHCKGNIGTNLGAINNFDTSTIEGRIYNGDSVTARCSVDLMAAYSQLYNTVATSTSHTPTFGSGETLTAGVYSIAVAASIAATLILDAEGDSNAVFIFKMGGALITDPSTTIVLINNASAKNIFWIAAGAIAMGASTTMKGTLISNNGAISLGAGGDLEGRMFSTTGAVAINAGLAYLPLEYSVDNSWTGSIDTAWNKTGNWLRNTVPTAINDVTIYSACANYPVVDSGRGSVNNLTIKAGAVLTVTDTLQIAGNIINNGTFNASGGTIELNGSVDQTIPANVFTGNAIENLIVSNNATLAGPVYMTGAVSFGNTNDKVFTTGGFLTLGSSATATARVADITNNSVNTGNSITGLITAEKYITAKRAFRFLTSPINTTADIRTNWMENTNNTSTSVNNNPVPHYGTHITGAGGAANAFDETVTNNPSLFAYDNQLNSWQPFLNPGELLKAGNAYRIMIRGSRSADLNNQAATPTPTILRATGTIVTGAVVMTKPGAGGSAGMPELSSVPGQFSFIGNPYPSPVYWKNLEKTDVSSTIYAFDPTINGTNGRGAFISYNSLLEVNTNPFSKIDNHIQSWQSFFVYVDGSNPSITFREENKTNEHRQVFRTASDLPHINVQLLLPQQVTTGEAADGLAAYFSDDFSNAVADEDSYKFTNPDENIAILRDGKILSLEGRKIITANDTLPLQVFNLLQKSYFLKIGSHNFSPAIHCFLEDAYLQTATIITSGTDTLIPFSITTDSTSFSRDRFRIVYTTGSTLPVSITSIKAFQKNNGAEVQWTMLEESNLAYYEIERSYHSQQFMVIGKVGVSKNSAISNKYLWFDSKPGEENFYRIKMVDKAGAVKYSEVASVTFAGREGSVVIFPNPVIGNTVNYRLNNVETGNYDVRLLTISGEEIYSSNVMYNGGSPAQQIKLNTRVAPGIYQLQVSNRSKKFVATAVFE